MPMIRHTDEPGSQAWLQRRLGSFNASDAPAMLGCSTNKTRSALLHELYTSIRPEFSDYVQARVIDRGHRIEEFMRPIAAEILDEDDLEVIGGSLPVEGLSRPLGASLDGRAMLGRAIWECKSINDELRANLPHEGRDSAEKNDGRRLHKMYRVQMEQQLMVDERAERTLFTAAAVDGNGNVTEERHCWYEPDPALRAEILAGWKQFDADLAAYEPPAAAAPAPVAKIVAHLPVVFDMRVEGKLVSCNLEQYKPAALQYIADINTALVTDQHFADAEADAKFCRESASKLKMAVKLALGQMGDINTAIETVEEIAKAFDAKGLSLEKLVRSEKDTRREEIVGSGVEALRSHLESLNKRLGKMRMPPVPADFGGAVKGKRNLDSMRDAVNTELARAKIAANEIADKIQANLTTLRELASDFVSLFPDAATIVLKAPDDLTTLVKSRIAEHKAKEEAKLEAERERIRKEEQEKVRAAQQDEDDTIEAIWRHARRIEGNRVGYVQKAIGYFESGPGKFADDPRPRVAAAVAEARAEMQVKLKEAQAHEDAERAQWQAEEAERKRREALLQNEKAAQTEIEQAVQQGELAAPLAQDIRSIQDDLTAAPISQQVISTAQRTAAAAPAAPAGPPTLKIGMIAERLGWSMTAEQMRARGIAPAAKERGSVLYHESQWPEILRALKQHLSNLEAEAANLAAV